MAAKKTPDPDVEMTDSPSGRTTTVTFRMPSDLAEWCKGQAASRGQSLNEFIVESMTGLRTWFVGVPRDRYEVERDCEALGLNRTEYLTTLINLRAEKVRELGPGFDDPRATGGKPGKR